MILSEKHNDIIKTEDKDTQVRITQHSPPKTLKQNVWTFMNLKETKFIYLMNEDERLQ